MPAADVPYRAYFFTRTQVAWFDATPAGARVWSKAHNIVDMWPSVTGIFPDNAGVASDLARGVHPASATVLSVTGGSPGFFPTTHLDVAKGALTPDPRIFSNVEFQLHMPSWDVGPIVMLRHGADNTAELVDLRDNSVGPPMPFPLDSSSPMLALPGEPLRWFTSSIPQQVGFIQGVAMVTKSAAEVFPGLPLTDPIVEATVLYGTVRSALADVTELLSDADMGAFVGLAAALNAPGETQLAAGYLLSGLRPTAYHPQGFFGIAQMTVAQLDAGGWTDPPELLLDAGVPRQIAILASYLQSLGWQADPVWPLAVLLSGAQVASLADATVIANAPYPPRLRAIVPVAADGTPATTLSIGDLRKAIDVVLAGPLGWELRHRAAGTTLA
jgi:hypothetical protein